MYINPNLYLTYHEAEDAMAKHLAEAYIHQLDGQETDDEVDAGELYSALEGLFVDLYHTAAERATYLLNDREEA